MSTQSIIDHSDKNALKLAWRNARQVSAKCIIIVNLEDKREKEMSKKLQNIDLD